jgi:hypothetical protein
MVRLGILQSQAKRLLRCSGEGAMWQLCRISVEEVEASMVAAAIRLSLQEADGSSPAAQPKPLGPTAPASLKMVPSAASHECHICASWQDAHVPVVQILLLSKCAWISAVSCNMQVAAAAAHFHRSRSGGSSNNSSNGLPPRPRMPFRSRSAGEQPGATCCG